jgi:hypothetical protein
MRKLNLEFNARLRKRLMENKRAIQFLTSRGLSVDTIEHFRLGLSAPYRSRKGGCERADALVYPLRGGDGKFYNKYCYYNVPGVTHGPVDGHHWTSGEPSTYYGGPADGREIVFVCGEALELWRLRQALGQTALGRELSLVCSTHRTDFPDEWRETSFWARWETVFIGYECDNAGEQLATALAELIGKDVRRVMPPPRYGRSWTDFWQGGAEVPEFARLLRDAPTVSVHVRDEAEARGAYGRFEYQPVDIGGAFHNGYLYYTVQVLSRSAEAQPAGARDVVRDVERLETVVVRSDRTVHSAVLAPAPKGTKEANRVLRLTDGTVIAAPPRPNKYGTWSWPSIKAYLEGRSKVRPLCDILRDVTDHLRASVWLPHEEDYALLTLVVPVTYAQSVFDSVPLILVTGPAGSGKSEMGRAMARVCCNAYVCGQSSAASIARFIDESRGFVVLDDLEGIGGRGGQFGELVQALKLSYNKATAVKLWTDVKTMRTQRLDFYGVKMINNTRGTGEILGSRMLRIRTGRIPEAMKVSFGDSPIINGVGLSRLRDELHSWTFESVRRIEDTYRTLYPRTPDRSDEITAPLKVMASLAGDHELISRLEAALTRQNKQELKLDDPQQLIREALKSLVAQGYDTVSPTHVTLEARKLLCEGGRSLPEVVPEWLKPEWVGRLLHASDILDEGAMSPRRIRLFGMNLRFFRVSENYLTEVKKWFAKRGADITVGARQPTDFCGDCGSCPYSTFDCEIMQKRQTTKRPFKGAL